MAAEDVMEENNVRWWNLEVLKARPYNFNLQNKNLIAVTKNFKQCMYHQSKTAGS